MVVLMMVMLVVCPSCDTFLQDCLVEFALVPHEGRSLMVMLLLLLWLLEPFAHSGTTSPDTLFFKRTVTSFEMINFRIESGVPPTTAFMCLLRIF